MASTTLSSFKPTNLLGWLDLIAILAIILASAAIVWRTIPSARQARQEVPVPNGPISVEGSPVAGSSGAKAAIVVFSDFECPFCRKFVKTTWPVLQERFVETNVVQVVFKQLPLTALHSGALPAAIAADCAGRQQKFWRFHDLLFGGTQPISESAIIEHASTSHLDLDQFSRCRAEKPNTQIERDLALARSLKIAGTPTFIVGRLGSDGRIYATDVLAGNRPIVDFERAISRTVNFTSTEAMEKRGTK